MKNKNSQFLYLNSFDVTTSKVLTTSELNLFRTFSTATINAPRAVWTLVLVPASNFSIPTFEEKKKKDTEENRTKLVRQVPRDSQLLEKRRENETRSGYTRHDIYVCIFAQCPFFFFLFFFLFSSSFLFFFFRCITRWRIHDVAAKVRGVRCVAHFGYYIRRNHPVYVVRARTWRGQAGESHLMAIEDVTRNTFTDRACSNERIVGFVWTFIYNISRSPPGLSMLSNRYYASTSYESLFLIFISFLPGKPRQKNLYDQSKLIQRLWISDRLN